MSEGATGSLTPLPASSEYQAALTQLRDTVKWMITAAAATAAVIVATFQVKGLSQLSGVELAGAAAGAFTALIMVIRLVANATNVLTVPRWSASNLRTRDVEKLGVGPAIIPDGIGDPILDKIYSQKSSLIFEYRTINEFYGAYVKCWHDRENISRRIGPGSKGRSFGKGWLVGRNLFRTGTDAAVREDQVRDVTERYVRYELGIRRLEDAAQYFEAQRRFDGLVTSLTRNSIVFFLAILVFGISTAHLGAGAPVTGPVRATIYVTDRTKMDMPPECLLQAGQIITGVITGGDLNDPQIVTDPTPSCPSEKYSQGFVAVPLPPSTSLTPAVSPRTPG